MPGALLLLAVAGLVVVLAAIAYFRGRGAPVTSAAIDPAAGIDPDTAYRRAIELGRAGRHIEGLPYLRRAASAGQRGQWALHHDLSAALNNAAYETWQRGPIAAPAARSSIERVAFALESLEELDEAERLAPDAATRALVAEERGQTLELWGFPWEALAQYDRALQINPGMASARRDAARCMRSLGVSAGVTQGAEAP